MKEVYARGRRVHTGIEGRYGVSHLAALRQGIPASGVDGGYASSSAIGWPNGVPGTSIAWAIA